MANRIQFRRETANRWASINPILIKSELGLETDTGKCKIGDGEQHWTELKYMLKFKKGLQNKSIICIFAF